MSAIWLLIFACNEPVELPPKVHTPTAINARMVQMSTFRGFLQRPKLADNHEAVLQIVDKITANERKSARAFPRQTVLIIDKRQNVSAALEYLNDLTGVTSVRTICTGQDCPEINAGP